MKNLQENKKLKRILKAVKKKVTIWRIIILIVFLTGNTFAWFIYAREVSNSIDVHVRAWNIVFQNNNQQIINYLNFSISSLYPGMDNYKDKISITSNSETAANISYVIMEANILGTVYKTVEAKQDEGITVLPTDLTSEQLESKLANDYPFSITFNLSREQMSAGEDESEYSVNASWPFESGNDAADTLWGNNAYEYMKTHNTEECIKLRVKVIVNQNKDSSN